MAVEVEAEGEVRGPPPRPGLDSADYADPREAVGGRGGSGGPRPAGRCPVEGDPEPGLTALSARARTGAGAHARTHARSPEARGGAERRRRGTDWRTRGGRAGGPTAAPR